MRYTVQVATRDQVRVGPPFDAPKNCHWWRGVDTETNATVARGGLLKVSATRFRLVKAWTNPQCRFQGIGLMLVLARMSAAWMAGAEVLETRTETPDLWLAIGWAVAKVDGKYHHLEIRRPE